jgi:hypothetical protein
MTRNRSLAVETHPPKSPPQAALYRWEGHEGGAATRRARGVFGAMTWVIVLRSDPSPKQEVNLDRSRKCSVFLPYDTERPIDGKIQRR